MITGKDWLRPEGFAKDFEPFNGEPFYDQFQIPVLGIEKLKFGNYSKPFLLVNKNDKLKSDNTFLFHGHKRPGIMQRHNLYVYKIKKKVLGFILLGLME